jgi:hypothetical protein
MPPRFSLNTDLTLGVNAPLKLSFVAIVIIERLRFANQVLGQ